MTLNAKKDEESTDGGKKKKSKERKSKSAEPKMTKKSLHEIRKEKEEKILAKKT